jgi:hypothetical protein
VSQAGAGSGAAFDATVYTHEVSGVESLRVRKTRGAVDYYTREAESAVTAVAAADEKVAKCKDHLAGAKASADAARAEAKESAARLKDAQAQMAEIVGSN